jgi:hypothetical protein
MASASTYAWARQATQRHRPGHTSIAQSRVVSRGIASLVPMVAPHSHKELPMVGKFRRVSAERLEATIGDFVNNFPTVSNSPPRDVNIDEHYESVKRNAWYRYDNVLALILDRP